MKFALVDLAFPDKKANREHTGGFGSFMYADGLMGRLVSRIKASAINLPVLNLAFAAAILRQAGHEVALYNGETGGEEIILIASSMHCFKEEIDYARGQKARYPRSKVGFFGPFPQTNPQYYQGATDFLIFGELESSLFAFLDGKHDFSGMLDYGVVNDLSRLPMPDWKGFDVPSFSYFPLLHKRPFLPVQSTRGCTYNCDFCPYMVSQTARFRRRKPVHVVEEIERNIRIHNIRSFLFRDICFTLNKQHSAEIAELMIDKNLRVEWACETRVDCLTPELIDLLHASGLRGVNLGLESPTNTVLSLNGKYHPVVGDQERMISYLHDKGIRINAFYMLGLIGDTPETMQATIRYAKQLNTMGAQFCITTPFPGTQTYKALKNSLLTDDYAEFTEYQPVADIMTASPEEVRSAARKAYRYYLRPSWLLKFGAPTLYRFIINSSVPRS